ncbi:MAG: hypothetical protein AAGE99_05445, partial [Chlamydiota bacterium]
MSESSINTSHPISTFNNNKNDLNIKEDYFGEDNKNNSSYVNIDSPKPIDMSIISNKELLHNDNIIPKNNHFVSQNNSDDNGLFNNNDIAVSDTQPNIDDQNSKNLTRSTINKP